MFTPMGPWAVQKVRCTTQPSRSGVSLYIADLACLVPQEMVKFADVVPTFKGGAHHPTVLVILQALLSLIGEVRSQGMGVGWGCGVSYWHCCQVRSRGMGVWRILWALLSLIGEVRSQRLWFICVSTLELNL